MSIQSFVVGSLLALYCAGALAQEAAKTETKQETAPPPATVTGSGTANYIPLWTGSSTQGNSKLYQTGGKIGVGTTAPTVALDVNGRVNVSKAYRIGGVDVLTMPGGTSATNVGLGEGALPLATGAGNTATGAFALAANTTGGFNTAVGQNALLQNTTASGNTGVGEDALFSNTTGNTNVACGYHSLVFNTTGNFNTASGPFALDNNTTGAENIAIGHSAAENVSGGNSNNIHIGSLGVPTDNNTIRVGTIGTQTSFFAAGVSGVTTGVNDAVPVVVDSNGQLGTVNSSRRFKEDIHDMGEASEGLMRLRPVTFRYQKPFTDGSKPVQYGLVAEEVAEVYPELVTHSADGQVESVKYQVLGSMLLNEVQKQQGTIQQQQTEIDGLKKKLEKVEAALASISGAK